ncbi:MAG TPA: hypothetical protein VM029_22380 [Opitutaceae bacterium]|nr:hypothetical protein [Opitutaceae bacterium]
MDATTIHGREEVLSPSIQVDPALFHTAPVQRILRTFAGRIVQAGAIMTRRDDEAGRHLVGELRWLENDQLFWFTAYGENLSDAHWLRFDDVRCVANCGLYFLQDENIVAYLCTIDAAGVEDPDDYRIAWQWWQQVGPLRAALIEDCWQRLTLAHGVSG